MPFMIHLTVWFRMIVTISGHDDQWGEPDPMERDFSLEEILDMPTIGEFQMNLTPKVTDSCILQSEGIKSESFGFENSDRAKLHRENSNTLQLECNEQFSQNSSTTDRDDIELIDIDSLFDDEEDDKPVLLEDEACELFS